MKIIHTNIPDVLIIERKLYEDHRGWYSVIFNKDEFSKIGIDAEFIQFNHSYSNKKHTMRGLHFQAPPYAQAKLIRCIQGEMLSVAVDLREESSTFKQHVIEILSSTNKRLMYVPRGFAHGVLTLSDACELEYMVDNHYSKAHAKAIRYDDPSLNINWGCQNVILSDKDKYTLSLEEAILLINKHKKTT